MYVSGLGPASFLSTNPSYQQAGMMKAVLCIFFFALLVDSCCGLNFTVPNESTQGDHITFQWNATLSDFITTNTTFVALLIKPSNDQFQCPQTNIITVLGKGVIIDEGVARQNDSSKQSSTILGSVSLQPKNSGKHLICAYGNPTGALINRQNDSQIHDDFGGVENLSLITQSPSFCVNQKGRITCPSSTPTPTPSPTDGANSPSTNVKEGSNNDVALILGGIAGGIAAISTLAAVFFYRRSRYHRKLSQFHKEHHLLNQTPPPSFLASTMATRSPSHGAASPPAGGPRSPGSPNASLGFDGKMDRSLSVGSSRSSHSVSLQHVPVLRAQHGPGLGASNV
ncbi:hypothetical protein PM082_014921 [Marasmius tenuissimus]|nr:hypothetical protein PM082_014921 [Marasmius tenuissimus]